ncbi:MAG TPA: hypothetical protein P5131_06030 [Methanoculleus sp.]|nr:hypothetical protein [Deltaproteobacteria bacterium]HPD52023.1 hypothetical protein [Methanoculleus sp.]HRR88788.1 hypothetical protein [Methanoculleus sp.]HRT12708.1 hypothetical protein [Methanoculleus sp.]
MRRLIDEYGTTYTVDDEVLDTPCNGEPTKRLYDLATGQAYDLPADLFDDEPAPPSLPPLPERTPAYQEKLVEVLLEKCTLNVKDKERVALLIGPALAIGKITSQEDFAITMMEVENLIRSLYISNTISEEDSVYLMDQIEFFARWQLRRSVTFDGKPNEREWWTIQSIHQKTEVKGEQPGSGGGILGAVGRAFGKGKWR